MRVFVVASSPQSVEPLGYHPGAADRVIAADGGANLCRAWGWPVHRVVGDMDSIEPEVAASLREQGIPCHDFPVEKDETDLEIAIHSALELGATEIIIAGALGARIDHTLGNLVLLSLPALTTTRCCIVDGAQVVWHVRDELTVCGRPGDTLSLIPTAGDSTGVSVDGVHWPLSEAHLPIGPSLGLSNRLTAAQARITVGSGSLWVVHTAGGPDD